MNVADNLKTIRERIEKGAAECGRSPEKITLVAVTKTVPASAIREAYRAGQKEFGESYAQELRDKAKELADLNASWHFIGHLQKNKAKYIARISTCWESVDSFETAHEVDKRLKRPISALIEVNLGQEESKSGVRIEKVPDLISKLIPLKMIEITGLMIIPPYDENPEMSRPYFVKLRELLNELNSTAFKASPLKDLSMGMSHDFEVAIEEGATIIRIGTAIFGER